jgi:mannose-1-phosphate guanylyltransferase/mannose-6-phosphate isomerase
MSYVTPLILCGGAGTRLWPVSRDSLPKQFAPIFETSTFRDTLVRMRRQELFAPPIVITSESFHFVTRDQMHEASALGNILLEPCRRDSGPAVAAGAVFALAEQPDAILLIAPSDHHIEDTDAFAAAVQLGIGAAGRGDIVTFGIRPGSAATGYGYILPSNDSQGGIHPVADFAEKPDKETATHYVAEGYLWNSGMFLVRADILLAEFEAYSPAVAKAAGEATRRATRDLGFVWLDKDFFASAPAISFDYAVMEHTKRAVVIPVSFCWSDLGSWDAVWALSPKDQEGNAGKGPASFLQARNCYAWSEGPEVVVVDLQDIAVVVTPDAVLVSPRTATTTIKQAVDRMIKFGKSVATRHAGDFRPWGHYQSIDRGERYQVKRLVVKPQGQLSLQMHHHRAEHWVIVKGTARVTINGDARLVHENESVFIPLGAMYRLENPGKIPLELIEVQTGSYLGEDDIMRAGDRYGRSTES